MAYIDTSEPFVAASRPPLAEAIQARFDRREWNVIALARWDGLASLHGPTRTARLLQRLFGGSVDKRLADPRLEALRRFAVLALASWLHVAGLGDEGAEGGRLHARPYRAAARQRLGRALARAARCRGANDASPVMTHDGVADRGHGDAAGRLCRPLRRQQGGGSGSARLRPDRAPNFRDGDVVRKGQLLLAIDRRPFLAAQAGARADVASAASTLDLADADLGRASG